MFISIAKRVHVQLRNLVTILLVLPAFAVQAAPSVSLEAAPEAIYLHEPFQLAIRVEDAESGTPSARFDTSGPAEIAGPSVSSENRMFSNNGRITRYNAQVLTYRVIPQSAGPFTVSNATVSVGGRTIACPDTATISVIGPEPSEFLALSLSASKTQVLVDEPFDVHLDISVRKLPSPFQNESPISLQATPALLIPYLAEPPFEDLHSQDVTALLNTLLAPRGTPGFTINGHTLANDPFGDPFGGGFPFPSMHSSKAVFAPPREEGLLGGHPSWNYRITTRFTADREGEATFAPVVFRGILITGVRNGNAPVTSRLFCESAPLAVQIVPPPAEGRPATYAGSVGTALSATASLDAQSCRQGDPVQLTLDVTGSFSQRTFQLPPLSDRPGFRDVFRVYESGDDLKTESIPNGLRFIWTLRPLQAGTLEVPPIDVAYYNTASNAYLVARSAPVPLRVDEVPSFNPDQLFAGLETDPAATTARAASALPSAITVGESALVTVPTLPRAVHLVLVLVLPPLVPVVTVFLQRRSRTRAARHLAARRRRAPRRVARSLRRARTPQAALDAAARYFHDVYDIPPASFTPADAELALRSAGVSEAQIREVRALLQPLYDKSFDVESATIPPDRDTMNKLAELFVSLPISASTTGTDNNPDLEREQHR